MFLEEAIDLLKDRLFNDDDDVEDDIVWPGIFTTRAGQIPCENVTITLS